MTARPTIMMLIVYFWVWSSIWADNVPIAPIQLQKDALWGEVYPLTTKNLTLLISPETGGVVSLKYRNGNERLEYPLEFSISDPAPPLTPEPQWESRAWRTSEGQQVVMLIKNMGPPLSLRVVKLIEVMPDGNAFRHLIRISSTGPGDPDLLAPQLSITMGLPESLERESQTLRTVYQEGLSALNIQWQLEQPASDLSLPLKLNKSDSDLKVTSMPDLRIPFAPQGWTLLCNLQMVFSVPDPDISSLEQTIKWPSPLN